jgi:hypothetical protein
MSFTKSQFDQLKEKGMFDQYESYFDYLAKTGQTSHRADFLEWFYGLPEPEQKDFDYVFGPVDK